MILIDFTGEYDILEEEEEHAFEERQRKKARFDEEEDDDMRRGHELQKSRNEKEVDEDALCDVCKEACYGVKVIPEGDWFCEVCVAGVEPKCAMCPQYGGAMIMISDDTQWAHVSCAIWIPGVTIENPKDMSPIEGIEKIPAYCKTHSLASRTPKTKHQKDLHTSYIQKSASRKKSIKQATTSTKEIETERSTGAVEG
ncbi:JADE1 [Mytilus coruscus]|uniref:JADE1 n=1 Tax=Mytilus coruscus TaxID=42192 RepID=A0A6J8ANE5_MYTCO|nr:JADE1 [Mytilus coruscus]